MKHYDALVCRASRQTLDTVAALSSQLPITGILDNDDSIVLYFDEGGLDDAMLETISSWAPDAQMERTEIEEQNWNAEFERSLAPVRVADGLILTQSWNPVSASPDELVVVIDPKMSFGTGHHESTRLISRWMMEIPIAGRNVLDIGTGTGVLAIIAALRGAERIVAFDNNEWSVENSRENFERNDVAERIDLRHCELDRIQEHDFDLIVANLHRNLIIELLPEIHRRFGSRQQILLTSGVLIADRDGLIEAAEKVGMKLAGEHRENEWVSSRFEG